MNDEFQNQSLGRRLAKAIGRVSINEAAEIAGCSPNTFRRWLKGESEASPAALSRIAGHFGVTLDYLIIGIGDESGDWETNMPTLGRGQTRVAIYESKVSAGAGALHFDGEPIDFQIFSTAWLRRLGKPEEMHMLYVQGDSMEPELRADDLVMVDYSQREPRESMFVFNLDDMALVKRLKLKGGGEADLVSNNPAYAPIPVKLDDELLIVGRVVWAGRSLR